MTRTSAPVRRQLRPSGRLLPEDTRRHHRALLLQLLFRYGAASRADLARSSGLTRVTVSDVVGNLVTEGLLTESAAETSGRVGKPPVLVQIAAEARQIVAVDLSAEGLVSGALLNLTGDVQDRRVRPLEGRRGPEAVALVHELVRELVDATDRPVLGIGVGTPGVVDASGVVIDAPNLGWHGTALAEGLLDGVRPPGLRGQRRQHRGPRRAHLRRHRRRRADADPDRYGRRRRAWCSRARCCTATARRPARSATWSSTPTASSAPAAGSAAWRRVLGRARTCASGSPPTAQQGLAEVGTLLGTVLAPVVGTLNLHELVLSGPLELLDGALLEAVDRTIRERTMPVSGEELVVRTSALGDDVVLVGAAVLVLAGQLGVS